MNYALNLDSNGRILSATYPQYAPKNAVLVDALPDGDISEYRYENGEYIHDPITKTEQPAGDAQVELSVWDELDAAYQEGVDSV